MSLRDDSLFHGDIDSFSCAYRRLGSSCYCIKKQNHVDEYGTEHECSHRHKLGFLISIDAKKESLGRILRMPCPCHIPPSNYRCGYCLNICRCDKPSILFNKKFEKTQRQIDYDELIFRREDEILKI